MKMFALALPIMLVASPAIAQSDYLQSAPVRVADLNLATAAGKKTLDLRLRHAVNEACADLDYPHTRIAYQACDKAARTSAAEQRALAIGAVAQRSRSGSTVGE